MPSPRRVARSVAKATEEVVTAAAQSALAMVDARDEGGLLPGAPAAEEPSHEEPTDPQGPLPGKPDQQGPEPRTPTGAPTELEPGELAQESTQRRQVSSSGMRPSRSGSSCTRCSASTVLGTGSALSPRRVRAR